MLIKEVFDEFLKEQQEKLSDKNLQADKEEYEIFAQKCAPTLGEEYKELLKDYEEDRE